MPVAVAEPFGDVAQAVHQHAVGAEDAIFEFGNNGSVHGSPTPGRTGRERRDGEPQLLAGVGANRIEKGVGVGLARDRLHRTEVAAAHRIAVPGEEHEAVQGVPDQA